jgi:hypothetical protein
VNRPSRIATTGARSGSSGTPQVAQARIELGGGALTLVHTGARRGPIVKDRSRPRFPLDDAPRPARRPWNGGRGKAIPAGLRLQNG